MRGVALAHVSLLVGKYWLCNLYPTLLALREDMVALLCQSNIVVGVPVAEVTDESEDFFLGGGHR